MSNLTPIKGSEAKKKGSGEELCPYCALVPASEHPAWSCPRLASASMDDWEVTFIDADHFLMLMKLLGKAHAETDK